MRNEKRGREEIEVATYAPYTFANVIREILFQRADTWYSLLSQSI